MLPGGAKDKYDGAPVPFVYFHGTTDKLWRKRSRNVQTLYLADDAAEALSYAYDSAASLGGNAIVLMVDARELGSLDVQPDWGGYGVTDQHSAEDTIRAYGSFAVEGVIQDYKSAFHIVDVPDPDTTK
jgi:hypothetical protein